MEAPKCKLCGTRHYGGCPIFEVEEEAVSKITKEFRYEYSSWSQMISRCYSKDSPSYPYYGAVGITVCAEWRSDFKNFLRDMGPKPSSEYTVERNDTNGNYEPSNCRWLKKSDQLRNTTRSLWVDTDSGKVLLMDMPRLPSVSRELAYERFHLGWSIEDSLNKPPRAYKKRREKDFGAPLSCPVCEARRLKQIEAQERYRAKKSMKKGG